MLLEITNFSSRSSDGHSPWIQGYSGRDPNPPRPAANIPVLQIIQVMKEIARPDGGWHIFCVLVKPVV